MSADILQFKPKADEPPEPPILADLSIVVYIHEGGGVSADVVAPGDMSRAMQLAILLQFVGSAIRAEWPDAGAGFQSVALACDEASKVLAHGCPGCPDCRTPKP